MYIDFNPPNLSHLKMEMAFLEKQKTRLLSLKKTTYLFLSYLKRNLILSEFHEIQLLKCTIIGVNKWLL